MSGFPRKLLSLTAMAAVVVLICSCSRLSKADKIPGAEQAYWEYDNWPIIIAILNGQRADVLLDTGFNGQMMVPNNTVSVSVVKEDNAQTGEDRGKLLNGQPMRKTSIPAVTFSINGYQWPCVTAVSAPCTTAILGSGWIMEHKGVLDFQRGLLAWPSPPGNQPIVAYSGQVLQQQGYINLKARVLQGIMFADLVICGNRHTFLVDSGANGILIDQGLANTLSILTEKKVTIELAGPPTMTGTLCREVNLGVGPYLFKSGPICAVDLSAIRDYAEETIATRPEGVVGSVFLRAHKGIVDMSNSGLYLFPRH